MIKQSKALPSLCASYVLLLTRASWWWQELNPLAIVLPEDEKLLSIHNELLHLTEPH